MSTGNRGEQGRKPLRVRAGALSGGALAVLICGLPGDAPEAGGHPLQLAGRAGPDGAGQVGLRLAGRYAGWDRRPFTAASDSHISVYQRP